MTQSIEYVNFIKFHFSACSFGHSEVVQILLDAGANPNAW